MGWIQKWSGYIGIRRKASSLSENRNNSQVFQPLACYTIPYRDFDLKIFDMNCIIACLCPSVYRSGFTNVTAVLCVGCRENIGPETENGSKRMKEITKVGLTFRHRASCILGQAFHYSPENAFYMYLINKYISLSDICLTVHH